MSLFRRWDPAPPDAPAVLRLIVPGRQVLLQSIDDLWPPLQRDAGKVGTVLSLFTSPYDSAHAAVVELSDGSQVHWPVRAIEPWPPDLSTRESVEAWLDS